MKQFCLAITMGLMLAGFFPEVAQAGIGTDIGVYFRRRGKKGRRRDGWVPIRYGRAGGAGAYRGRTARASLAGVHRNERW